MKKATMVTTSIIVAMLVLIFSSFSADPTNQELGQGMLKMGTEIGNLKKKPAGISEERVNQLINKQAVTMDGKTLKDLKATDAELQKKVAGALDPVLILKAAKFSPESIEVFKKLDLTKPSDLARYNSTISEALAKIAEKPAVDWNSPQAQGAIDARLAQLLSPYVKIGKVNYRAGDLLPDGTKATADGVREETIAEASVRVLVAYFASKEELVQTKESLGGTQKEVTTLTSTVKKNGEDIKNLEEGFEWEEVFTKGGKPNGKILKSVKLGVLPQDVKTAVADTGELMANVKKEDGKVLPIASEQSVKDLRTEVDKKADQSALKNVETDVANLSTLALKKDKAYVFVYASYMLKNDEAGFRAWLKPQVKESEFEEKLNDIKAKAKEAKAKNIVRF